MKRARPKVLLLISGAFIHKEGKRTLKRGGGAAGEGEKGESATRRNSSENQKDHLSLVRSIPQATGSKTED